MNRLFKISIAILLFILSSTMIMAQQLTISISGLTCSQCSRSVEMQLKKIKSISAIAMNLKTTEAKIQFKNEAKINYKEIAQAVYNAGFSIDKFELHFSENYILHAENSSLTTKDGCFQITNNKFTNTKQKQYNAIFKGKPFSNDKIAHPKSKTSCQGPNIYYVHLL